MSNLREFRNDDMDQMKRIERALVQVLLPFRASTNPVIVCLALLRCCRTVLRLTSKSEQREITPVLVAFLQGRTTPPPAGSDSGLILPSEYLN